MNWLRLLIVFWLIVCALLMFYRGATRTVREYTMTDAIVGLIETALIIWGVLSL